MELINQHTKKIMEGCKERARKAGLRFQNETLEYIVTNRDLLELSPKLMIPTLYDYWVHDVKVLQEKGQYELYPANPYETVINTRPPISFYNDNNPDWLNVMIFYHVLAHIDFFQNNLYYRHTWDYDFTGKALADKRMIARFRSEKGRWVDYVIEFARGIDNLAGYHYTLSLLNRPSERSWSERINFYFDVFLQKIKKKSTIEYIKEVERYNTCLRTQPEKSEALFFENVLINYPEFKEIFEKSLEKKADLKLDIMEYLIKHSEFLNKEENKWMKSVIEIVRDTSLFFQPQIRTKIMNEGWSSFWHEILFLQDDRIKGHEVDFARINAQVTSLPRMGINPYALGMRLFYFIQEMADKGKYSFEFEQIFDTEQRKLFDKKTGCGKDFIFKVRENFSDFTFINTFLDQDFATKNKLFVTGMRLNKTKMVYEYYIKSKKVADYRKTVLDALYHPPNIEIIAEKTENHTLYLNHYFEGKQLVKDFIANTMTGIEFFWKGPVQLETSELITKKSEYVQDFNLLYPAVSAQEESDPSPDQWERVIYTMGNRKLTRKTR
jgi:stage V sporulation protein R